jgi:hypothetical protein
VRILLDDSILIAGNPKIALIVYTAAVATGRQRVGVSPGIHDVAFLIKLDYRWCWRSHLLLFGCQVASIHNKYVIT